MNIDRINIGDEVFAVVSYLNEMTGNLESHIETGRVRSVTVTEISVNKNCTLKTFQLDTGVHVHSHITAHSPDGALSRYSSYLDQDKSLIRTMIEKSADKIWDAYASRDDLPKDDSVHRGCRTDQLNRNDVPDHNNLEGLKGGDVIHSENIEITGGAAAMDPIERITLTNSTPTEVALGERTERYFAVCYSIGTIGNRRNTSCNIEQLEELLQDVNRGNVYLIMDWAREARTNDVCPVRSNWFPFIRCQCGVDTETATEEDPIEQVDKARTGSMDRDDVLMKLKINDLNFLNVDIQNADLSSLNLSGVNLRGANLWGANLSDADLQGADLSGTIMRHVNLKSANLQCANLQGSILNGAILRGTIFKGANLKDAIFRHAVFEGADLRGVSLQGADLRGACLDFVCWPLRRSSSEAIIDEDQARQFAYHIYASIPEQHRHGMGALKAFGGKWSGVERDELRGDHE